MSRSRLSFMLVLSLLCAQLFLAWHGPSHIESDSAPHEQALLAADCDLCGHSGVDALPSGAAPFLPTSAPVLGQTQPQPFLAPWPTRLSQARAPPYYA